HHQLRLGGGHPRPARLGALLGRQGRGHGLDAHGRGGVGALRHHRQLDRAGDLDADVRGLPAAHVRAGAHHPRPGDAARDPARRAPGRPRARHRARHGLPRRRRRALHHRAGDRGRRRHGHARMTAEMRLPLPALEPESERFWRACREGRLEITRCRACGWYVHPPRPVCPRCQGRDVCWEAVSGRATVVSYTVNHQRWMPGMEVPYAIGLVELIEQADLRLTTRDIDGLACYPGPMGTAAPGFAGPGTPEVQEALGLQLGWHGSGGEGPAQLAPVMLAALAVAAGLCRHALVYRTVTEAT